MSAASKDVVVPFMFENLPVRGALVQLEQSWQRMQQEHDYSDSITGLLGEATAATALIAQGLKFDGNVTLQLSGEGLLSMLVVQCTDQLHLRGMARAPDAAPDSAYNELVDRTRCSVIVDSGAMEQPYQGIVAINQESLASSLEDYFERSVQLTSRLVLIASRERCAGLLLQQMPDRGATVEDDWHRLGLLAATLTEADFVDGAGLTLIHKLFNEDDVRVYDQRPVLFRCRCSRERAEQVLQMLGPEECQSALEERQHIDVTCEYCGRRQTFDAVDVSVLFAGPGQPGTSTLQ